MELADSKKYDEILDYLRNGPPTSHTVIGWILKYISIPDTLQHITVKEGIIEIIADRGIMVKRFSLVSLLTLYVESGQSSKAEALYNGLFLHTNTPVCKPFSVGLKRLSERDQTLNSKLSADAAIFGMLIKNHANAGNVSKSVELLDLMIKRGSTPSVWVYNSVLKACSINEGVPRLEQEFYRMISRGIYPDLTTYKCLLRAYADSGDNAKVEQVCQRMIASKIHPDAMTSLLNELGIEEKNGNKKVTRGEPSLPIFKVKEMNRNHRARLQVLADRKMHDELLEYLRNGPVTTRPVLASLMKHKFDLSIHQHIALKERVLEIVADRGVKPDSPSLAPLLLLYAEAGMAEKADALYQGLFAANERICSRFYTYLIKCHGRDKEKVEETLAGMKKGRINNDISILNAVLKFHLNTENPQTCLEMIDSMIQKGSPVPNLVTFCIYLDACIESRLFLDNVADVCQKMKTLKILPDTYFWNIVMKGYCHSRRDKEAISVWKMMIGKEPDVYLNLPMPITPMTPSLATLSVAIDICKHGNMRHEADDIWMYAQKLDADIPANVLTSYIECLVSFDGTSAEKAVDLIFCGLEGRGMPLKCVKPNEKTIVHARWCLSNKGFYELLEKLNKLHPIE